MITVVLVFKGITILFVIMITPIVTICKQFVNKMVTFP